MFKAGEIVLVDAIDSGKPIQLECEYIGPANRPDMHNVKILKGKYANTEGATATKNIKPHYSVPANEHSVNVTSVFHTTMENSYKVRHDKQYPSEAMTTIKKRNPCECGAHVIKDARHSHWCPEFR